jgi:hypothetical protein
MRPSKTNILISSLMILVFTTFNAGIPVVVSLCPMMSMENPDCEMNHTATKDALSFASEIPDCCTSHIVAERNTIPYLSVEQFKILPQLPLHQVAHVANDTYLVHGQSLLTGVQCVSPSPPFPENVSLFILNSTLLI